MKAELTFLEKVSYRYWRYRLLRKYEGTIFDRAISWETQIDEVLTKLLSKKDIVNVIVTGAPFHLMYHVAKVCTRFPNVNLIADFRDPWTNGFAFGIKGLSAERKAAEFLMESETVKRANKVIAPAQPILDHLRITHQQPAEKFHLVPHGFDPDDFRSPNVGIETGRDKKIAFVGSAYDGLENEFKAIFAQIRIIDSSTDILLQGSRFLFYSKDSTRLMNAMGDREIPNVVLQAPVPAVTLFAELCTCDVALIVFSEPYRDFISTKFFELLHLGLPLLYIGPEGEISRFILSNGVGECVRPELIHSEFIPSLKRILSKKKERWNGIDAFEMSRITEVLSSLLK